MNIEAVYLDMDGVLSDFVTSSIEALGFSPDEILKKVKPGDYDGIYQALGMDEDAFWFKIGRLPGGEAPGSGLWESMKPYPWRNEVLEIARNAGPTWILTSPSRAAGSSYGKVRWLQRWLGESFRDYILAPRKWNLARPGTLLIDDSDGNVRKWRRNGGDAILFPRLWNSAHVVKDEAVKQLRAEIEHRYPVTPL